MLEALVLKGSGFKYAPFAMSRYYLEHIDEYFTLFNVVRKAEKHETYPNTAFVEFFLGGMREVINKLHNRVNMMVSGLLFHVQANNMLQSKMINMRQFTILYNLMGATVDYNLKKLQSQPWYKGLYSKVKTRTQYRDLKQMIDLDLIQFTKDKRIKLLLPGL